jgi:hypothetical protein
MYSRLSPLSDADIPVDPLPKRESTVENGSFEVNTIKNFSFLVDNSEMLECFLA